MADVKDILRARFAPVPLRTGDKDLDGMLFVRRLRVSELRRYLEAVTAKEGPSPDLVLLSLSVCDANGDPVFSGPDEVDELLGELWRVQQHGQLADLAAGHDLVGGHLAGCEPLGHGQLPLAAWGVLVIPLRRGFLLGLLERRGASHAEYGEGAH